MEIAILDVINVLITIVAGVTGWLVGRRKQRNDFLSDLQKSIDLLSAKNKELVDEVVTLRGEVIQLKSENKALRKEIEELNEKLSNVKTITKRV
jgi:predicted  nucleic acid-binding Zn-ribbon protein